MREFKVGDKVKVISTDGGITQAYYLLQVGKIVEVHNTNWNHIFYGVKFTDNKVTVFLAERLSLVSGYRKNQPGEYADVTRPKGAV